MHAKLLVAIPVLLAAEAVMHMRTCRCIERIVDERWVEPVPKVLALIAAAERRRDSGVAEVVVLALAVIASQALLWGLLQPLGVRARTRAGATVGGRGVERRHRALHLPVPVVPLAVALVHLGRA